MSKKQEMINDLIRVSALFKEEVNSKDYCQRDFYLEHGEFSKKQFVDEFGSFSNFRKEAMLQDGYEISDVASYTEDNLTEHKTFEDNSDGTFSATSRSSIIRTPEELLIKVGLNPEEWKAHKPKISEWGNPDKPMFSISCQFIRRDPATDSYLLAKEIIQEAKKYAPKYKKINYKAIKEKGNLLEISLYDHHFGQLAWGEETGYTNYDLKIAEKLAFNAIEDFINKSKVHTVEKILVPIGNDFFNSNNSLNTTFAGTLQSEDDRYKKTFKKGWKLWVHILETLSTIAPVDALIIPGNHDAERTFYLGEVLDAWFSKNTNISIDNGPKSRKYYQWGKCLLGFTHGDKEIKIKGALPHIMATEEPQLWAESKYREWHKGHLHHAKMHSFQVLDEHFGVREWILPSLVAIDDWHSEKGYAALRQSIAMIWNKESGQKQIIMHNPIEVKGE